MEREKKRLDKANQLLEKEEGIVLIGQEEIVRLVIPNWLLAAI
jgi:hypothetical protein